MESRDPRVDELCHLTLNLIQVIEGALKKVQSASMAAIVNASRLNQNYKIIRGETETILERCGEVEERIQTLICNVKDDSNDQSNGR